MTTDRTVGRAGDLQQFLLFLGSALTAAGEAVNRVEEHLRRVAAAYGAPDARVSVLPTYLVVALEPGRPATLEPTGQLRGGLRLDQTAALFEVLRSAERGHLEPDQGSRQVQAVVDMPPRFGVAVRVLGHAVLTVGICLVLKPTWGDLVLAAVFGVLVGLLKLTGARLAGLQMILPVAAAFAVATLTFLLAGTGWADADLRAMVAPLVTFLPGAMLTMAVVEISAAEMITGSSRLVTGFLQLLLLAFGIIGATHAVGTPPANLHAETPAGALGEWAPWIGVLIVGIGSYLLHSGPPRSLGWLCLVLYAGWIGQYLGGLILGGYLSGLVGAVVLTVVAYTVERVPSGPPALVSFLPGFWLLVPGALSLIGMTEYLSRDVVRGAEDLLGAIGSMVAVALGVLCGHPLFQSLARAIDRTGDR
ncbi:threonine/serine ThrE exporter family protein [Jidongwangia harbinensis]|uniref:threonine/serine ThrE exporter family protein n=1 Tax=Jidongwangia harbinensis TaxID=2878561 RepID=UPI001CD9C7D0|nr:threonine/serine exporter family protein [Jidongwangia harbinensis]MCA2211489.1 threonine/serine exporter family protein [Jidongwangia harbinensis]